MESIKTYGIQEEIIMKKRVSLIILLVLALAWTVPAGAVTVVLNQRMATRSGPGTQYTEELGTYPRDTAITLIEYVQDINGVPWGLVEFYKHNILHRAYTGMKRIDVIDGVAPYVTETSTEAAVTGQTNVYYGPGYHYGARKNQLYAGAAILVYRQEGEFLMCDFMEGGKWARGYIPGSNTTHGLAYETPQPQAVEPALPAAPSAAYAGDMSLTYISPTAPLMLQWQPVHGATEYQVSIIPRPGTTAIHVYRTPATTITLAGLPTGYPCTIEILALVSAGSGASLVAGFVRMEHVMP